MEELEKKLRLAADSSSFAKFGDRLDELIGEEMELQEDFLENVAGGAKKERKEGDR